MCVDSIFDFLSSGTLTVILSFTSINFELDITSTISSVRISRDKRWNLFFSWIIPEDTELELHTPIDALLALIHNAVNWASDVYKGWMMITWMINTACIWICCAHCSYTTGWVKYEVCWSTWQLYLTSYTHILRSHDSRSIHSQVFLTYHNKQKQSITIVVQIVNPSVNFTL